MKPLLPPEIIARVKAAYDFGIPAPVIGRIMGISPSNIWNWASGMSCDKIAPDPLLAQKLENLLKNG